MDASVVVELLLNGSQAERVQLELIGASGRFAAPELLDVEVLSALRRMLKLKLVDRLRSARLLDRLGMLPVDRYSHVPLVGRIWELRENFTSYDAAYIALAEALGATLLTCDGKLSKGHRAKVKVI